MEKYIFDENNGLWYELQGNYYIPCLKLPEQETKGIGVWGMRHLEYLKQHRRGTLTRLRMEFKLNSYLYDINSQAEGITEQLKSDNQMEWVAQMNNIRQRATEIANDNIIYN